MSNKVGLSLVLTSAVCLSAGMSMAAELSTNAALMQAMDKVTGRVNKMTVPVNSKVSFGDFSFVLRACKKRPAEETPENFAFVDVTDKSFGSEEYNIFRGWMVSSTPGINAIEHPIYDVWLLECVDTEVDSSKLLSAAELQARDALPTKESLEGKAAVEVKTASDEAPATSQDKPKVIHIEEFIQQDRDIEKNIAQAPAYISETSSEYVSDIEEGDEPENLLQFTKMQEVSTPSQPEANAEAAEHNPPVSDDLAAEIEREIKGLHQN